MKAVAIYCVDGRLESTRQRTRAFMKDIGYEIAEGNLYGITKPGPDASCAGLRGQLHEDSVIGDVDLLLERGVEIGAITIIAHAECAGHPVDNQTHEKDVHESARRLYSRYNVPVVAFLDEKTPEGTWELKLCKHLK